MSDFPSPFKRVYFDITHEQHAQMVENARAAKMSQRGYLAKLIQEATGKGGKKSKK